jgi:hypothetical protein
VHDRYEQSVREKEELEKKLEDLKMSASSMMPGGPASGGGGELQSLRQEFAQYRKRAMNAVEQKEKELSDIHAQYGDVGGGANRTGSASARAANGFSSASMRRMSTDSSSSLSGFDTPNAITTNEYLKNIVYKYMTTDQNEVSRRREVAGGVRGCNEALTGRVDDMLQAKEHMEKAIATVLNFSPTEVTAIQVRARGRCELENRRSTNSLSLCVCLGNCHECRRSARRRAGFGDGMAPFSVRSPS